MAVVKGTGDRPVGGAGCSQPLHSLLGVPTVLLSSVSPIAQGALGDRVALLRGQLYPASGQMRASEKERINEVRAREGPNICSVSCVEAASHPSKPELL